MSIVLLLVSVTAAEGRGMMIPVPDEDGPGSPRPQSPALQAPQPDPVGESAVPPDPSAPLPADGSCHDDRCRRALVWHVTNKSDKSCLDVPTNNLGDDRDIAKLRSLLPATSFIIAQGECAR